MAGERTRLPARWASPGSGRAGAQSALACAYDWLVNVERGAGGDRAARLAAVHDGFYRGEIAAEIVKFSEARDGLLGREDFARSKPGSKSLRGCVSAIPSCSNAASGPRDRPNCRPSR